LKTYLLHRVVVVPRPLEEVFAFFADPGNLARITPPWLAFEMVGWRDPAADTMAATGSPPGSVQDAVGREGADRVRETGAALANQPTDRPIMAEGLQLDYRVRPLLVPQRWTSVITVWEPPDRFTDEQLRGPYGLWRHEHLFAPDGGGTRVEDRVEYSLPFGGIGRLAHMLLVRKQLRRIFEFRLEALKQIFDFE